MNIHMLHEESYEEEMKTIVEPWLREHQIERWPEREFGQRIHCVSYRAEKARGILLISHGFSENAEKYREIAYYFVQMRYHVFIPEHCGHGLSYRLTDDLSLVHIDRFERYVDDLQHVAERIRQRYPSLPLYLFGHSMGGGIAAALCAKDPWLLDRLILSAPMIRPSTGKCPWILAEASARLGCMKGKGQQYLPDGHPYEERSSFESSGAASAARFDYFEEIRFQQDFYHTCSASYGWLREAARLHHSLQAKAWRRISIPVLVFQAEEEQWVSSKEIELFARKIAGRKKTGIRLVRVPDSRHEIYLSRDRILRRYLRRISDFISEEQQ